MTAGVRDTGHHAASAMRCARYLTWHNLLHGTLATTSKNSCTLHLAAAASPSDPTPADSAPPPAAAAAAVSHLRRLSVREQ
jgi:hypothetical protein